LKARFKKTAIPESAAIIEAIDEDHLADLATYSQNRLKSLQTSFPNFTTRERVYFKDEPTDRQKNAPKTNSRNNSKGIPEVIQSDISSSKKVATMSVVFSLLVAEYARSNSSSKISPTEFEFNLLYLDIVSSGRQRFIVCTDEHNILGVLHHREFSCLVESC
jgi:hypothetical protein